MPKSEVPLSLCRYEQRLSLVNSLHQLFMSIWVDWVEIIIFEVMGWFGWSWALD